MKISIIFFWFHFTKKFYSSWLFICNSDTTIKQINPSYLQTNSVLHFRLVSLNTLSMKSFSFFDLVNIAVFSYSISLWHVVYSDLSLFRSTCALKIVLKLILIKILFNCFLLFSCALLINSTSCCVWFVQEEQIGESHDSQNFSITWPGCSVHISRPRELLDFPL